MGYYDTPYASAGTIANELNYAGIKHVRDAAINGWQPQFRTLAQSGIRLDLVMGSVGQSFANEQRTVTDLRLYVRTVEGPNEVDLGGYSFSGLSGPAGARAAQQAIWNWAHPQGLGVVNFSVTGSHINYGDNSSRADYGNAHVYFRDGTAPGAHIRQFGANANQIM